MHKAQPYYEVTRQRFYSLLMLCLLSWLTICMPFVYEAQQDVAMAQGIAGPDDDGNPLSGANEEKAEAGSNTLSEYLHELPHYQPHVILLTRSYKCSPDDLYQAFHPELVVPPPDKFV
jgi:hypothetical protein